MTTYQVKKVFGDGFLPDGTPTIFIDERQVYGTDAYTFKSIREWLGMCHSKEVIDEMVSPLETDSSLTEGPVHTIKEVVMQDYPRKPLSEATKKMLQEILAELRKPLT